jgi:hypothetical protein
MALAKKNSKLQYAQRRAQRTGDSIVLQKVLFDMFGGDKICTRNSHLEDAEVFGWQKRKPDTPIRANNETNRPDTIKFSRSRVAQRTTISHALPPSPPLGLDFCHFTVVQESKVDEKLEHIAHVLYNSSKACWAMHVITKKKCTAKIVSNSKSTHTPAYLGV